MKRMMIRREHMMQLVFALLFVMIIVTILISTKAISTENEILGKPNNSSNISYYDCMKNASTVKTACYNTSRITGSTCRDLAMNESSKNQAKIKKCNTDFNNDFKKCTLDSNNAKKNCKKISHTFQDTVKAIKYE